MKEFSGIGGYAREPEGYLSWQHLTFVSLLMIAMIALAVFLGLRNKCRDSKAKNAVLVWAAILIDGFEIFKIILNCSQDPTAWQTNLPLFLCSIQLITIPLAAFTRGRIKEAALDFVCIFGLLGAVLGTIGAGQNYNAYPVLSFPNVVSGITHCISGFASLYIMISGMISMKRQNMWITFSILGFFCASAMVANKLLDYNYMFLRSHDGTPYSMFYDLVGGHPILYPAVVILLFLLYITIFYLVYFLIQKRKAAHLPPA
jgi:uncharacterized membrane protein YwaF